jgi:steroid 5-alpha reductase family enzyme
VAIALICALWGEGHEPRRYLVLALIAVWGLRLGLHIFFRNRGHGEDPRYARWRQQAGDAWWWKSYLKVFLLQGFVMWVIAAPIRVVAVSAEPDHITALDVIGTCMWLIGFYFEAVGDLQLRRFKENPANQGQVMDRGLWRFTRHPNYFGDALTWWGIGAIALSGDLGWLALIGPALMTFLLMRVSGVVLLEQGMEKRRPGYRAYIESTNAFFPGPKKGQR